MSEFQATITDLGNSLYLIDAGMHGKPERLACYLFDTPERVLIEIGPSNGMMHVREALERLGIDDVAALLVTHIHLDHSGAAGHFAAAYPRALIGVHAKGARHLVDPSRLTASAERIYGVEGMAQMWGPIEPVPEDRILVLDEGSTVTLGGGRRLEVMYTPGHAKHHVVYTEEQSGGMFVGDSVGVAYPHGHMVQPVTPPPDFDHTEQVNQLRRMAAREPQFVGFAHYGVTADVQRVFAEAEVRLDEWVSFVEGLPEGADAVSLLRDWVLERYRRDGYSEELIREYDEKTFWPMQPQGIQRWLQLRNAD